MSSHVEQGGERRAAGELLAARLRLAVEAAQLGLWEWDLASGAVVWDERSLAMLGRSGQSMPGHLNDLNDVIHPEDLPSVTAGLQRAQETAGTVDLEYRVVWRDGQVRWLNGRGQALVDDDGQVVRMLGTNADVTELRAAALRQVSDARRMAGLVAVAQALGGAGSEADVLRVVTELGVALLGAHAAVLCVTDRHEAVVRAFSTGFRESVRVEVLQLPLDFPLPMVDAAVNGAVHFFDDRPAAIGRFPGGQALYEQSGTHASAAVPLHAEQRLLGSLSVGYDAARSWRDQDRELLGALATLTSQALARIWAQRAERRLSETLQRTLLTSPPQPDHLQIAVRYQPAAEQAQVGGDWYDAFLAPGGVTTLVIGDVAGHDQDAAAGMAQFRNVLRGVAQTLPESPGAVLSALDRALEALAVPALATAVLCQVTQDASERAPGPRQLRWSNAGHPPPLLIDPDGDVHVLQRQPDLLLGLQPTTHRFDHQVALPEKSTVVLYTDGLVERRGESLDVGIERLRRTAHAHAALPVEQLADQLLHDLAAGAEDDVALLVVRACAQGPGPPRREAGARDRDAGVSELHLTTTPQEVGAARRFAVDAVGLLDADDEAQDRVRTLVSELVTNVVLHARTAAVLTVQDEGERVRVQVTDGSPAPARQRRPGPDSTTGRGMRLLASLSADSGSVPSDRIGLTGKTVWFTVQKNHGSADHQALAASSLALFDVDLVALS